MEAAISPVYPEEDCPRDPIDSQQHVHVSRAVEQAGQRTAHHALHLVQLEDLEGGQVRPRSTHAPVPACESPNASAKFPNADSVRPSMMVTRGPTTSRNTPKKALAALRHRNPVEKTYCSRTSCAAHCTPPPASARSSSEHSSAHCFSLTSIEYTGPNLHSSNLVSHRIEL